MPVDLYDLISRRSRSVTVTLGPDPGDTIVVRYKPDAYTKQVEANLLAANQSVSPAKGTAEALFAILESWDLTAGTEPYLMTLENVEALGLPIGKTIWNAINADFIEADTKKG